MMTGGPGTDTRLPTVLVTLVFVGIVVVWAGSGVALALLLPDWTVRGAFGDAFGFANSLFSGLALAGVIVTILLQRRELALQREELKLNTEELRRSADAQEKSERAIKDQADILRKTLVYQAFASLTDEYREAHMLQAIRTLWDFHRDIGAVGLAQAYLQRMDKDAAVVTAARPEARVAVEASTLHHQRRIVSQYYSRIATFIDEGIIPRDIFYSSWGETDLRIIPMVLVPLENAIRTRTQGAELTPLDDSSPLMQLYLGSKEQSKVA